MIPDSIERDILIEAPIDVVWRVITEPDHIAKWFCDSAELDLRAGGDGALTWEGHGRVPLVVESVEPPHRLAYRWSHDDAEVPNERNSTLVEFTLVAEGEHTRVRLVESGLLEVDWTEERKNLFLDSHTRGWDRHLADLVEYAPRSTRAGAEQ